MGSISSGGAGLAGCWSRPAGGPYLIETFASIGARRRVAEGVILGEGSRAQHWGCYPFSASTRSVIGHGRSASGQGCPPYSVGGIWFTAVRPVVPILYVAVIVKRVDEKTRPPRSSINECLRALRVPPIKNDL